MRPTTVLFDWARVIRDVSWGYAAHAMAPLLGESDKARLKRAFFPQLTELERGAVEPDVFWMDVTQRLGLSPSPDHVAAVRAGYLQVIGAPIPETMAVLEALRHTPRITVAIFSNSVPCLRQWVEHSEERRLVDAAFYSCDLGSRKPEPRAFEQVLEALEATREETVFIDDQEKNVAAAAALGIRAVRFDGPSALTEVRHLLGLAG